MKATINRIALLTMAFLPFWASAQHFPNSLSQPPAQSGPHPKLNQPPLNKKKEKAVTGTASAYPVCVFDEMNAQHCGEDHGFQEELHRYLNEALPMLSASGQEKSVAEPLLTVSVVVHIIHNGEPIGQGQNISDAQVIEQIAVLNEDFASLNSQFYNTPSQWMGVAGIPNIQFCLANKKPDGSPTNGIDRKQMTITGTSWSNNNINSTIKPATNWTPSKYFNVYVLPIPGTTALGGVVGYSNYPLPGQIGGNSDGVVIDYRWFGGPSFPVSGYRSLTHETGHFLGLPHPFNGNSCSQDDGIADTPNMDAPTRDKATLDCEESYPMGPVSCGNEHMYVNYMDYVTENCYTSFTAGQVNVMRGVLNGTSSGFGYGSRNGLLQNAPLQCAIPSTDAGITRVVSPTNISCTSGNQLTPVVSLRNFGTNDLTSVAIKYKLNNGPVVNYNWQGNLFPGENEEVSLTPFMPSNGSYTLTFWTSQPNNQADQRISNDSVVVNRFTYLASAPPSFEDVENETIFPTSEGIFDLNISNDEFTWQVTDAASGFGDGGTSFMFDNYNDINGENPLGTIDALITRHFDFTNMSDAVLKFDIAYAPYIEDVGDSLIVLVATNCSQTFNQIVYRNGGVAMSTAPTTTSEFTPTAAQWRSETIDLSNFDGMSDVSIALVNKSAFGNRLFLDNIGIGANCNGITSSIVNVQPDNCAAGCNGAATVQVAQANGALQYHWQGFENLNASTNSQLCSGTTSVTVTDAIGCEAILTAIVPGQQAPTISTNFTFTSGYAINDATATVTVTNGIAPFSYAWSNGFTQTNVNSPTSVITGLSPQTYSVTVTDAGGCSSTSSVLVESVCSIFSICTVLEPVSCHGGSDGSLDIDASTLEIASIVWRNSNGQVINDAENLPAGTYQVSVTSTEGCPISRTLMVPEPPQLTLSTSATGQTQVGVNNGTATVVVSGGTPDYSYEWSNGSTGSTATNLAPGPYTVSVTDYNGCVETATVVVNTVSCIGLAGNLTIGNLDCFGENNGSANAIVSGGTGSYSYIWSNGSSAAQLSGLSAGPIAVTVSDGIGCVLNLNGIVNQPPPLNANATSTEESAIGANDGTATLIPTGGTFPYQYLWGNGATTNAISGLSPGNYSYTITDNNGCAINGTVTITTSTCFISLELNAIPTTCPDLANGAASAMITSGGTGPFTYLWSNGGTSATINQLTSGTYSVTVSDGAGCSEAGQVTVASNDITPPTLTVYNQVNIQLDENGQYALIPAELVETSADNCSMVSISISPENLSCENLGTAQIIVTATDNSGNSTTRNLTVNVVDAIAPVIICPQNITLNSCEAVNYSAPTAMDNCTSSPILALVSGLPSSSVFPIGTTEVVWQATDNAGNTMQCTFEITVNSDLQVVVSAEEPSCHGYSDGSLDFEVIGGQSPYDIDWSAPFPQNQLPAGSYFVTVTDANGCSKIIGTELMEPTEISFTVNSVIPATTGQSNGVIDFTVSGGTPSYTVTWLQGGNVLPNFNPASAPAGSYQARIVDSNGCIYLTNLVVVTTVSSSFEHALDSKISIAPNPSTGAFFLQTDIIFDGPISCEILDGTGRCLHRQTLGNQVKLIDLQAVNAGVYWLKIQIGEAIVWKKIVKI